MTAVFYSDYYDVDGTSYRDVYPLVDLNLAAANPERLFPFITENLKTGGSLIFRASANELNGVYDVDFPKQRGGVKGTATIDVNDLTAAVIWRNT